METTSYLSSSLIMKRAPSLNYEIYIFISLFFNTPRLNRTMIKEKTEFNI